MVTALIIINLSISPQKYKSVESEGTSCFMNHQHLVNKYIQCSINI